MEPGEGIWRAVVEAHEREVMMQHKRKIVIEGTARGYGAFYEIWKAALERQLSGSPCEATPDELAQMAQMAQMARFRAAMAEPIPRRREPSVRMDVEEAIRAYARKLIAQRAAIVKSERITRTVHDLIKAAGGEPRL